MIKEVKCPICGKINERTYYTAEIGVVEDYYYCDNCGYGTKMCYSPTREYIDLNCGWDFDEIKKVWSRTKERSENMSCNTNCICLKCTHKNERLTCCIDHNKDCYENMIGACFDYNPVFSKQANMSVHKEQNEWFYDEKHDDYICLKCHKVSFSRTQYCPHCGQKMVL